MARSKYGRGIQGDGLIPHTHLWYRADRVVAEVCRWLDTDDAGVTAELGRMGGGKHEAGVELDALSAQGRRLMRRWFDMANGVSEWARLPMVDDLLCALGLNMTAVLGEPDLHCSMTPQAGESRGWRLGPPPTYDDLAADPGIALAYRLGGTCVRGHEKTPENVRLEDGRARCVVCDRERKRPHIYQERMVI